MATPGEIKEEPKEPDKKGLTYVGIGQTTATLLGTAFWLTLVLVLHPTAYGHLTWLISIATLVSTVAVMGLGKTIATYYPKEEDKALITGSVALVLISSILVGAITALSLFLYVDSSFPWLIGFLVIAMALFSLTFYTELGKRRYKRYMWIWIGTRSTALVLPIVLYFVLGSIAGIIGGLAASYFLFGGLILRYLPRNLDFSELRQKAVFSFKAWVANIGKVSMHFMDKILIGILFPGMAILGIYQFSYRIFTLLAVLPNTLFFFLLPEKARGNKTGKTERLGIIFSVILAFIVFLSAPYITSHVFPGFLEGVNAVRVMALAVIPATLARIKSSKLFSEEKAGTVLLSRFFGLGVGIIGIITTFYMDIGITGLAFSMLSIQISLLAGLFLFSRTIQSGLRGKIVTGITILALLTLLSGALMNIFAPRTSVEEGHVFTIEEDESQKVLEEINSSKIGSATMKKFQEKGRTLSKEASVSTLNNETWEIRDGENYYKIKKDNGLKVYEKSKVQKTDPMIMDTVASIKILTYNKETGKEAIEEAFQEIRRIEKKMDESNPESDVYKINQEPGGEWVEISPETTMILKKSKQYGSLTNGSFDITVKPLVDFWMKEVKEKGTIPKGEELEKHQKLVDLDNLEIDEEDNRARLKKKDMKISLGGIAKGYAADRAAETLRKKGIKDAIIDIGGEIRAIGPKSWEIGISDPENQGEIIEKIQIKNKAVSTSGNYRRYHLIGEEKVHHIINPKTGEPAEGYLSVTVVSETGLEADALSTGAFVAGPEKGLKILESAGTEGICIRENGEIEKTESWNTYK